MSSFLKKNDGAGRRRLVGENQNGQQRDGEGWMRYRSDACMTTSRPSDVVVVDDFAIFATLHRCVVVSLLQQQQSALTVKVMYL